MIDLLQLACASLGPQTLQIRVCCCKRGKHFVKCSQAIYVKQGMLFFRSDKGKALAHVHGEHSILQEPCISSSCLCHAYFPMNNVNASDRH